SFSSPTHPLSAGQPHSPTTLSSLFPVSLSLSKPVTIISHHLHHRRPPPSPATTTIVFLYCRYRSEIKLPLLQIW
ncbi:hypothetical protein L195_g050414, partial [Trifolium pratense]